jgi:hypothetical protein
MCEQNCESKNVFWDIHILFLIKKDHAKNMKKIVGAVWELPAN